MKQTIVGVFERYETAKMAAELLSDTGFGSDSIQVTESIFGEMDGGVGGRPHGADVTETVRGFFSSLFGQADEAVDGQRRGGAVVTVSVNEDIEVERARDALQAAGAIDIDEQVFDVPVARGPSDRWFQAVAEPHAEVADAAPSDEWSDPLQSAATAASSYPYDADNTHFRRHFGSRFAQNGGHYDDYAPAYHHGLHLARDSRHTGRRWDDVEADARNDWEAHHPATPWEQVKEAVRHGWHRMPR